MVKLIHDREMCVKKMLDMANAKFSAIDKKDKNGNLRVKLMACNFLHQATEEYLKSEADAELPVESPDDTTTRMSRLSLYEKSIKEEPMEVDQENIKAKSRDSSPDVSEDLTFDPPSCVLPHTGGVSEHSLINSGPHRLVFKLTSTNNKDYGISQSHGFIEPYGYCDLKILRERAPPQKNMMMVIYGIDRGGSANPKVAYKKLGTVETVEVPLIGF